MERSARGYATGPTNAPLRFEWACDASTACLSIFIVMSAFAAPQVRDDPADDAWLRGEDRRMADPRSQSTGGLAGESDKSADNSHLGLSEHL
jgi:hypothetical protein